MTDANLCFLFSSLCYSNIPLDLVEKTITNIQVLNLLKSTKLAFLFEFPILIETEWYIEAMAEFSQLESNLEASLALAKSSFSQRDLAKVLLEQGILFEQYGNFVKAIEYYQLSIENFPPNEIQIKLSDTSTSLKMSFFTKEFMESKIVHLYYCLGMWSELYVYLKKFNEDEFNSERLLYYAIASFHNALSLKKTDEWKKCLQLFYRALLCKDLFKCCYYKQKEPKDMPSLISNLLFPHIVSPYEIVLCIILCCLFSDSIKSNKFVSIGDYSLESFRNNLSFEKLLNFLPSNFLCIVVNLMEGRFECGLKLLKIEIKALVCDRGLFNDTDVSNINIIALAKIATQKIYLKYFNTIPIEWCKEFLSDGTSTNEETVCSDDFYFENQKIENREFLVRKAIDVSVKCNTEKLNASFEEFINLKI